MPTWCSEGHYRELRPIKADMLTRRPRRLLVSQNRKEIFLTFAEYEQTYLDYAQGKPTDSKTEDFLRMTESPPSQTAEREEMRKLGDIILAWTMQTIGAPLGPQRCEGQDISSELMLRCRVAS